ncbi:DNA-binding response regulator [Nocardia panacis]|uniref:DNA-binding response regulator n=1 Tax=Nocardia panacis TaxID=2340916 RepID=A0A3A4KIZ7_9NOCA|nr:response regulator transcription factor [Nocardia panacis]RJO73663.1 DNA-binding response regulator [Nocardia panacis]
MTLRILLVDDHATFRSGLRLAVQTQPDMTCVGEAGDGRTAIAEALRLRPDIVLLDIRMPKLDGLAAAEAILAVPGTGVRVVVLTTYDIDDYVYRALRAGASGFLLKSMPTAELVAALRVAARGDALIDPTVTRRLIERFTASLAPRPEPVGLDRLTAREREVLGRLAEGKANAEIAAALGVSEETVKTHVSRILSKLGLRDRVQAVVYAHVNGLA